ncbi:MAG: MarR family winged helix-turn-helix transcriptional regulator [Sphingobacteriales bacterium JAD_PAG50586_3]|nr:MAG: MarR family winged helix-turn-helix transcriptional regulator [Sphingobacteriales bacterium JAD_PAG50586_3]
MKDPNDSIGYLLMQIGKQRRTMSNALLNQQKLHSGQDLMLYHLMEEDGQTASALAAKLEVKAATISNMVDRMTAEGLLERRKGTIDKRTARVFLTAKGRSVFSSIDKAWEEVEDKTTKGLSIIEKFMLKRLLH